MIDNTAANTTVRADATQAPLLTRRRERPTCHGCGAQPHTPLHPDLVDRVMRCTTCHCLILDQREHAAWLARRAVNSDWARQLTNRYAAAATMLVEARIKPIDTGAALSHVAVIDATDRVHIDTAIRPEESPPDACTSADTPTLSQVATHMIELLNDARNVLAWHYRTLDHLHRALDHHQRRGGDTPRLLRWRPGDPADAIEPRYTRWRHRTGADGRRGIQPPSDRTPVQALTAALNRLRAMARTQIPPGAFGHLVLPATGYNPP